MAKKMFDKMLEELKRVESILKTSISTGKIPEIERDIMLSKLRNIYEFLLLYQPDFVEDKTSFPQNEKAKTGNTVTHKNPEPVEISMEPGIEPEIKPEPIPSPKLEEKSEPKQEKEPRYETKPVAEKPGKPIIETATTTILAEKFTAPKSFLNEVLTKYSNTYDIAKKFQNSPINDIFTAIGINEKFLFIRELFNDNAELFQSTMEKLNQANNFNEAIEYIDNNFTWNFESATVHKLLELIRRRHTSDRE